MTPAKKPEPAVAAKPARRRTASAAKAEALNTGKAPKAVMAVDPGSTAKRSTKRAMIGVLKITAPSAEITVKRAAAATGKTAKANKA
jgi:hypothetical protein